MTRSLLLLTSLAVGCAAPDTPQACTDVGCDFAVELELLYVGDERDLVRGTSRACRNDACAETVIVSVPPPGDNEATGNSLNGADLTGFATLWRRGDELFVHAALYPSTQPDAQPADEADVYTLAYRAEDGRLLVEGRWITRGYLETYPNGVECEPVCREAQLERVP